MVSYAGNTVKICISKLKLTIVNLLQSKTGLFYPICVWYVFACSLELRTAILNCYICYIS